MNSPWPSPFTPSRAVLTDGRHAGGVRVSILIGLKPDGESGSQKLRCLPHESNRRFGSDRSPEKRLGRASVRRKQTELVQIKCTLARASWAVATRRNHCAPPFDAYGTTEQRHMWPYAQCGSVPQPFLLLPRRLGLSGAMQLPTANDMRGSNTRRCAAVV